MFANHSRVAKKRTGIWVVLCLLLASAIGCARATPTPEPVTISFAHPNFDQEYYQGLVQTFNESFPYITIELQPKRWDMLGGLGAGNADTYVTSQFALSWLQEQGNVLNLTPFIEQDESFNLADFASGTVDMYTKEGKIWGIPSGVDLMVMYYNQDLFDEMDAPYPQEGWTWNDFLETAIMVSDPNDGVFGYAPNYELFDPLLFIYQHGGRIFDDLQNPTRTTFDDPLTIEALEWFAALIFRHNVAPSPEQAREAFGRGGSLQVGVLQNKAAMWTGMLSERGGRGWPVDWDMRWGVVPLPEDRQSATLSLVDGYFISAQAQHPEACWEWVSFLSQRSPGRQVPVRTSLLNSAEYERQVGEQIASAARSSLDGALLLSPELAEFEPVLETFGNAFLAIVNERSTPEEAMVWAQQQSDFK